MQFDQSKIKIEVESSEDMEINLDEGFVRGTFEIGQSSEAEQAEEGEDKDEEVRDDLGKKTMEGRKIKHGKNKRGGGNLFEGRYMKQNKHTIEGLMKTYGKL